MSIEDPLAANHSSKPQAYSSEQQDRGKHKNNRFQNCHLVTIMISALKKT